MSLANSPSPQLMSPPSSITTPRLHILYYGLVVVGTTVVVLALYNLIIVRCSVEHTDQRPHQRDNNDLQRTTTGRRVIGGFKYKKDGEKSQDECVVCLSVFEEGEELSQMPNCKHCFHAPCIDMWLYSHMDCPLCRSPAFLRLHVVTEQLPEEHSREGLLGAGALEVAYFQPRSHFIIPSL